MPTSTRHLLYWAKTSPDCPEGYHPVVYHCLDVAAVGRTLLEQRPRSLDRLAAASSLSPSTVLDLVTLLLSFHDLGKLADGFQSLAPELMQRLQGTYRPARYDSSCWKHDTVGYVALERHLHAEGWLAGLLPQGTPARLRRRFAHTWLSAAMGHHGRPPVLDAPAQRAGYRKQFPPQVEQDLLATAAELRELFLPAGLAFPGEGDPAFDDRIDRLARSSWLFAGLAVVADWIGSNTAWFPPCVAPMEIREYFAGRALPRARKAVEQAGLVEPAAARRLRFRGLWPGFEPTPLQRLADEMPLAAGPQLIVIEEVTGGGKTEAAFTLAHRLIAEGRAEGLYIGLPTMATANAMFDRIEAAYRKLYTEATEPSLVLAHSGRHLREVLALETAGSPPEPRQQAESAGAQCAAWLSDGRKKALLADVGVGTVDQALLAVLQARHQSLRLWGVSGKVLVVDEVHAADAYMQGLLACLLEAHAAGGGSAVLLSATLPARQRQALCRAFARGAGLDPPAVDDASYPALLHLSCEVAGVYPLAARPAASREVAVRLLHDEAAVDEALAAAVEAGGCACWIRNTVADAVTAWERWAARLGGDRVTLFHARFTVDDRNAIERDVLSRFGPRSGPGQRAGRLVIATQVVEQSLDLDFDAMVSDLAPIDLLIQRAGRLRRHRRQADGARTDGPEERGEPVLFVHTPPPALDCGADWCSAAFPGGSRVYQDHGALWLGARWLGERGRVRLPEDLREIIEHVYGDDAFEGIPVPLQRSSDAAEGRNRADRSVAGFNAIGFADGYRPFGGVSTWSDDVAAPTRLGEPTSTVRLARVDGGEVRPWHAEGPYRWDRSQVSVRQSLVASEWGEDQAAFEAAKAGMPDQGRYAVLVLLRRQPDGTWAGRATDARGATRELAYDPRRGLVVGGRV